MTLLLHRALDQAISNGNVQMDFLLPTGIFVPMRVSFYANLSEIKSSLWHEASQYPLFNKLQSSKNYHFVCVNRDGPSVITEELLDESLTLFDIQPLNLFLKVVEKQGDEKHKSFKNQMKSLLGKAVYDNLHIPEVVQFREGIFSFCQDIVRNRNWQGQENKLLYLHPPGLRNVSTLPEHLQNRLSNSAYVIIVTLEDADNYTTVQVPAESYPHELIQLLLDKRAVKMRKSQQITSADTYILKVRGQEDYIYGTYPIKQFKYMYECLVRNTNPHLVLVSKNKVLGLENQPPVPPRKPSISRAIMEPLSPIRCDTMSKEHQTSLWNIQQSVLIRINSIAKADLSDGSKVKLVVGLYHGFDVLCEALRTAEGTARESNVTWHEELTFKIKLQDIPRMSRLCCALCKYSKSGGKSKKLLQEVTPIAWVNLPMFDFKSRLQRGEKTLHMWPVTDDMQLDDLCNPIGTVAPNPQGDKTTTLFINFSDYNFKGHIIFPSEKNVFELAYEHADTPGTPSGHNTRVGKVYREPLQQILDRDPLFPMHEQDKDLIWKLRNTIIDLFPNGLSKVLCSVNWSNHIQVATMELMVDSWPILSTEQALELLDFAYPVPCVRDLAVRSLNEKLSDDDLSQYLLQLVQALKYESYLQSSLVKFLLTRALNNRRIGHQFFWLLRSEIEVPSVAVEFGLILEVYCKVCQEHSQALLRQTEALNKLRCVNELVKNEKYIASDKKIREKGLSDMHAVLNQKQYYEALSNLECPLTPMLKVLHIRVNECKFMDSKKRPLWLVWNNNDILGENINILYKNGDDLRQDMLTLQLIHIMDSIWQAEGLDLRMNAYRCIATGKESGMIEVVLDSQTIASIMKQYDKNAFNKKSLFEWLKLNNPTSESLDQAVEEFTLSCAGYCVATYVLGIGDRHSDNIMVKKSGQLFHIDFGHFLGNFKSKFGVKRERVPFVLTNHFVHVISKGQADVHHFESFRRVCEKAYLALRHQSNLLVTLFSLMLSTGIPQLTCVQDIDYLRDALALTLNEGEALQQFRVKFNEALKNSWKTSLNWEIHNRTKNNP